MTEPTPSPVPPGEPDRSLRISIVEGNIEGASCAITHGPLLTGFALMLGANEFHLGAVTALNALSVVGNLVAAWFIGGIRRRKWLTIGSYAVSRLLWLFLGALWFLPIAPAARMPVFLSVLFLSGVVGSISGNTWLSWMSDLVPPEQRGRYWGKRNTINGLYHMAAGYGASWIFDWMSALQLRAEAFALLFGLAAFWSCASLTVMSQQWEPPLQGEAPTPILKLFGKPFRDAGFRRLLLFSALWSAVTAVASPFFAAHMITNLHMSYATIALYSVVGGLIAAVVQPLWGRLMDHAGCRPVLVVSLVCLSASPLFWLFAKPGFYWPLWLDAVVGNVFGPGFGLALFNLVLAAAPQENRMAYLGVQSVVPAMLTVAGSLLGGWLTHALHDVTWGVGGQTLLNFHLIFALSVAGRLALIPLAHSLHEDKAHPVGVLLSLVRDRIQYTFVEGFANGIAVIKRLRR